MREEEKIPVEGGEGIGRNRKEGRKREKRGKEK